MKKQAFEVREKWDGTFDVVIYSKCRISYRVIANCSLEKDANYIVKLQKEGK